MKIIITIGNGTHGNGTQLSAELNETKTAARIYVALPLEGRGRTWGEEIYFPTPVEASLDENAREVLEAGELGYWPPMQAFCIFYGPTPASRGNEIRAAGPVNVFGKIRGDLASLKNLKGPVNVVVERGN